ncbi:hypothetical protein ONZ45_g13167 [Pleurotus djamor]|nr:hypothetical protein ONZ45_g13167 [Pleurotus djamor]
MNLRERVYRAHLMHLRIQKHSVLTKLRRFRKQNPEKRRGLSLRQRYRNLKVGNNFLRTRNRELGARVSELNRQNQQWQTTNHQLRRDVHFWKLMNTSAALFNELAVPEEDRVSPNRINDLRTKARLERDGMTFQTTKGTFEHISRSKECAWWKKELEIRFQRSNSKGKGKMVDVASSDDYVSGVDIYPAASNTSGTVGQNVTSVADERPEDKGFDSHTDDHIELLQWEEPVALPSDFNPQELENEIFSALPPGALPVTDTKFVQELQLPIVEAESSTRPLDDDADSRHIVSNKKHAPVNILGDSSTICPVIIASDKTQLSQFSGSKVAYPIYLTIGNIPKVVRRKPSRHACVLLGYLSADKIGKTDLTDKLVKTRTQRLFHKSLSIMLESLKEAGRSGVHMTDARGNIRKVFPIISSYVADYPEQCLISCSKYGTCPKCRCNAKQLQDLQQKTARTPQWTSGIINDALKSTTNPSKFHDYCLERNVSGGVTDPFWKEFPYTDIHLSITPDVLHQLYQGVLKTLVQWCQQGMSKEVFNQHVQRLPPTYGVRHFKKGISNLSQVTGPEHKQIAKILLACCGESLPREAIAAARHLLDFIYLAQYKTHDDDTLGYLQDAIRGFHENREIFIQMKAREHFNIPKFHAMLHYVESIRLFGSTDNYNTEMFERLHIDFAKDAWRATNKKDELPQMIRWHSRHEKMQDFSVRLKTLRAAASQVGPSVSDTGRPRIAMTKVPHGIKSLADIEACHHAKYFISSLKEFSNVIAPVEARTKKSLMANMILPFEKLEVWNSYKLLRESLADDDTEDHLKDQVKAIPGGPYDTVVVITDGDGQSTGLEGTKIGRVKVIFRLPNEIKFAGRVYPLPLVWPRKAMAYVEWYQRSPATNPRSLFYTVKPLPKGEIIPIENIRQTCMLAPKWEDKQWSNLQGITSDNVLDHPGPFVVNNFSSLYAFQTVY